MNLSMWIIAATVLLAAAQADPTDKGPQMFAESKEPPQKQQKQHKRQHNYETKEVILYLTPTQIRALESGEAKIETQLTGQPETPSENPQPKEEVVQNVLNEEGQQLQREYESLESDRKQRLQLQEAVVQSQKASAEASQAALSQTEKPLIEELNAERYPEYAPQLQLFSSHIPKPEDFALPPPKQQWRPNNYQYLYFFPNGKPQNKDKLNLFYPELSNSKPGQLEFQPEKKTEIQGNPFLNQKFQLIPYQYGSEKILEAQQLLNQLGSQQIEAQQLDVDQLENIQLKDKLVAQQLDSQLLEEEEFKSKLESQRLEAQQLENEEFKSKLEAIHLEAQEREAQRELKTKLDAQRLQAQQRKNNEYKAKLEALRLEAEQKEALELKQKFEKEGEQFKAALEAQQLEAERQAAQRLEAQKLDDQLETQQWEAEVAKAYQRHEQQQQQEKEQQQHLKFLSELQSSKDHESVLTPLFKYQNILETFNQQNKKLEANEPKLEKGFVPSNYAPKYNEEKYASEVGRILKNNALAKQKAFAKAEAISKEAPVIIHNEVKVTKHPVHVIKQVNVPMPYYVRVPEPYEVKVPQPYPVPLEIVKPYPVPFVKTEKIEIERPVPIEIEKHVPVPVTKKVYVHVDKPYYVERRVPVEVEKKTPVPTTQKFSLIRHIWN